MVSAAALEGGRRLQAMVVVGPGEEIRGVVTVRDLATGQVVVEGEVKGEGSGKVELELGLKEGKHSLAVEFGGSDKLKKGGNLVEIQVSGA